LSGCGKLKISSKLGLKGFFKTENPFDIDGNKSKIPSNFTIKRSNIPYAIRKRRAYPKIFELWRRI
jgi:hypothetical protein